MQVSHQTDHVTHAIIGGKQSIEFGISNSAEFFNILSSTLYKDQILAVVREVLCNAWDAHIEAGCTDRPVLVTLTEDTFTIKDFGKGIHQDDMGIIYGTYGNSTKKNDGTQTGGFGLGCKAPFAYTDNFEVVSCHAGIRTIYSLSKSSAQAMGKPGITPIASFPSTDTGLTVTIRIKPSDYKRFNTLVNRISRNGDMNVHLNGHQIETLNFDTSKHNFLMVRETLLDAPSRVMVRYGNVIYPVDSSKNEQAYSAIVRHMDRLNGYSNHFSIVFQAPPHSIAVTPSRESLSMQDHTVKTLGELFKGFMNSLNKEFKESCETQVIEITEEAVKNSRIDELLKTDDAFPIVNPVNKISVISDFDLMAKSYLSINYPGGLDFRKSDITRRLKMMVQANLLDRGMVSTFLRDLKEVQKECDDSRLWRPATERNNWLQKRVVFPLINKVVKAGLSASQLYCCTPHDHHWKNTNIREGMAPLVPAVKSAPHHLLHTLPFLRNIVVLATRRADLTIRAYRHEVFKAAGQYTGYMVYIARRKKGEAKAVRTFFANSGMKVVDLITDEEKEESPAPQVRTPRKPIKKGVPKLSSVLRGDSGISLSFLQKETAERTESPLFMLKVSLRNEIYDNCIEQWNPKQSSKLVKLFGNEGGVTNSTAVYDKWCEKGAIPFDEYVENKICSYVLNNPRIQADWAHQLSRLDKLSFHQTEIVEIIEANVVLSKEFAISSQMTEEDRLYFSLWKHLEDKRRYYTSPKITAVKNWLASIPSSKEAIELSKILKSPLMDLLNLHELSHQVRNGTPDDVAQIVSILKLIFKP